MKKRILALVMAVTLIVAALPIAASAAYTGAQFTDNKIIAPRLEALLRAYEPEKTYFTSSRGKYDHAGNKYRPCSKTAAYSGNTSYCGSYDGNIQCLGYAKYAQSVLFGKTESGRVGGAPGGQGVYYTSVSYPSKAQILKMPVGTHFRTTYPHSAILLRANSKGVTVVDCNVNWSCKVSLRTIPWSQLTSYRPGLSGRIVRATYPSSATYPSTLPVSLAAVTTTAVNLRTEASTTSTVIKTLPKNTPVTIVDKGNANWYVVRLADGTQGYISQQYLKLTSGVKPTAKPTVKPTAKPTAKPTVKPTAKPTVKPTVKPSASFTAQTTVAVNLRKGAGTGYAKIKTLPKGLKVTVISTANKGWYQVKLSGGQTGYVSAQYLKKVPATPKPTVKPTAKPSVKPTAKPTAKPSVKPTVKPTAKPSVKPGSSYAALTTTAVNLRKGMGTNYAVVKTLQKGLRVTVTSTANKTWYKVKLSGGQTGYVSARYLKKAGTAAKTMVTTAYVHLRAGKSTGSASYLVVPYGTRVTLTDTSNKTWYKVKIPSGKTGYIHRSYLK